MNEIRREPSKYQEIVPNPFVSKQYNMFNSNHYTQEQVHVAAHSWLTYEGDLSSLSCNDLMIMSLWVVCMCRINVDSLTNCRLQWPHFNNGANRWTFLTWRLRSPEKWHFPVTQNFLVSQIQLIFQPNHEFMKWYLDLPDWKNCFSQWQHLYALSLEWNRMWTTKSLFLMYPAWQK